MPDQVKTFSGSLVLDLRIWWRHVHTLYSNEYENWNARARNLVPWVLSLPRESTLVTTGHVSARF